MQADRIEELRTRLRKYAETHVTMAELVPQLHIDCMVQSEWLTQENIESLSVLEPYGMKNAEPVFCMKNMTVEEITPLSSDRHVRLSLIKDGKRFSAIWFGIGAAVSALSRATPWMPPFIWRSTNFEAAARCS